MKISIYELLGLIKDGKAPKTIRWYDDFYKDYDEISNEYDYLIYQNLKNGKWNLNSEVEMIEEKETNNIEKLNTYNKYTSHNNLHTYMKAIDKDGKEKTFYISEVQKEIINKVNELIDVINELKGNKND